MLCLVLTPLIFLLWMFFRQQNDKGVNSTNSQSGKNTGYGQPENAGSYSDLHEHERSGYQDF